MATTKKKPTSKKPNKKEAPRAWTLRFFLVSIGIFILAVSSVIVISLLASHAITAQLNKDRLDRIQNIYGSLKLDDEKYITQKSDVFGDKRVYEWDKGRTYSSAVEYLHADTVSNTATELDGKIKAIGFKFIDEPYPGSTYTQYHYKSEKGEYIRLTVSGKPYWDAIQNNYLMTGTTPDSVYEMDKNAGPSKVIIKVNLDDNNE